MLLRLIIGLLFIVIGAALAARRAWWLFRLIRSGQPANGRLDGAAKRIGLQFQEVFGQRRLLKRPLSGLAHFFTMWGFFILMFSVVEAGGALFDRDFSFWWFGRGRALGFLEDFMTVSVLIALAVFGVIRIRNAPERKQRSSRFYGSHNKAAALVLVLISLVMITSLIYRGAQFATGHFPYGGSAWPFASYLVGHALGGLPLAVNTVIESVFVVLNVGVIMGFLVLVLNSKHLHIALAPMNVSTKRTPDALGPLLPMESGGKPIDFEDPDEDAVFGRGKVEDFTWKGMLDFATCTECGRCQDQCPAWKTGKPLSPKLVIMDLRDHLFAKAPYLIEGKEAHADVDVLALAAGERHGVAESGYERIHGSVDAQAARPLVGTEEQGGVIDPDVLWSCTSCGACVEQCPVDIEHVDHIVDMRRYQVLIESEFPTELGTLFKNLENKGNPWGQNQSERMDWAKDLDFDVPVHEDGPLPDEVEYLYWIGCAGAFDDQARKTVRATAELLNIAGVNFRVLGNGESCTGDPARRSGNEFLFQMMAGETKETLNGVFEGRPAGKRKIVTTCPHCLNTLGREYPQLDGHYEVVHHTQLLNKLVREKKLTPVKPVDDSGPSVTYHDPCYLGRHNKVYEPPRDLVSASGAELSEMPRHANRALCCGAGGARMWMEEKIGKRINLERVDEAIATEAETIVTGCPFCRVMISDGLTERQSEDIGENVNVRDVSQLLLESVKRSTPAD